ncbi:MAG TPA: DUF2520 domain-containing protein [Thermoanaerobaculia bacterium]|nr:DUF2520 domain-containing protein [Thermoanaerobaculia bacterium]
MPAASRPLSGLDFCLAGAGRVGASLAHWAVAAGARPIAISYHTRQRAAEELAGDLAARAVPFDELTSGGCDLLLVAVPDPALVEVAERLARRPQALVALHTSGSRGAEALAPLAAAGSATGALHPLKAFPRPLPRIGEARGVFFALDGAAGAIALAERLVAAWDGVAGRVPGDRRDLYHLAASLCAGGTATLLATAARIAAVAQLPPAVVGGYLELARGALIAVAEEVAGGGDAAAAITGPVARGDEATVTRQLAALTEARPDLVPLVAIVGRQTLARRGEIATLSDAELRMVARLERMLG